MAHECKHSVYLNVQFALLLMPSQIALKNTPCASAWHFIFGVWLQVSGRPFLPAHTQNFWENPIKHLSIKVDISAFLVQD